MAGFYAKTLIGQATGIAAPTRLPGSQRVAEDVAIEGLRGFAALLVMAAHFSALFSSDPALLNVAKFATTGVDLFFVLSGFVFAPYLLGRPLALLPHLIRRFFRLYPLYLLALLAYVIAREPAATAWVHFPAHLLMAHTTESLEIAFYYNPAFWSLPPEVEFYLLLPLLARWGGIRTLVLTLALSLFIREWLFLTTTGSVAAPGWREFAAVHLPGLLCEFALGAAAYVLADRTAIRTRAWPLAVGLCLLALVVTIFATGNDAVTSPAWIRGHISLIAATGYAFVVVSLANRRPDGASIRRSLLLTAGHLSYGVYLFHNLAPPLVQRAFPGLQGPSLGCAAIALTLLLALVAHYLLERPLRSFGRRLAGRLQPARS